jgi:hypothetical protein
VLNREENNGWKMRAIVTIRRFLVLPKTACTNLTIMSPRYY